LIAAQFSVHIKNTFPPLIFRFPFRKTENGGAGKRGPETGEAAKGDTQVLDQLFRGQEIMSFLSWARRNWADTDEGKDPTWTPLDLPVSIADALARIETAIASFPRWQMVSSNAGKGIIKATRCTRLFRFIDDITIRLESVSPTATRVHARSQSRVGKGDFGQNRRNLLELLQKVRSP
jgi:uncharacterized protein (DUF1499 family)